MFVSGPKRISERINPKNRKIDGGKLWKRNVTGLQISWQRIIRNIQISLTSWQKTIKK